MRNNRRRSSSARQSEAEESGTPPTVGEGDEDGDGKLPPWAPSWAVRQRIRDLVRAHRAGPECWPGWPRPREASGGLESPPRQSPTRCPFRVPVRHFRSHLRSSSVLSLIGVFADVRARSPEKSSRVPRLRVHAERVVLVRSRRSGRIGFGLARTAETALVGCPGRVARRLRRRSPRMAEAPGRRSTERHVGRGEVAGDRPARVRDIRSLRLLPSRTARQLAPLLPSDDDAGGFVRDEPGGVR